ncbi:putative pyrroloquinoline-quinone binding quinoprotein [Stackebrandtia albiflava]|uniref:Putative pyrroloquinoline-quinone binding quinoprotein n=1 Tax=Stackebrandtia albiflava TaxID=406432 RepID=A0A562V1P9_9ACTN|nr:PQQ-binding-like beta-propeller repeat protein [Stackebrandtia albiflava]TWJ11808.1 putative pyrroloquinoline-quinone binding quinoprotein [Stackebrandtia albiflava]
MANSESDDRRRTGGNRALLRNVLLYCGAAALVAWVILLSVAVFTEPSGDDLDGTWLAVATLVSFLAVFVVLSMMVTHPGWMTGLAGGVTAVGAAVGAWLVYSTMPEPGVGAFITHRHAIAALAFAFGVIGGALLVLGEMAFDARKSDDDVPAGLRLRFGIPAVALVVVAAGLGIPAMHTWADKANTEASQATGGGLEPAKLRFEAASNPIEGRVLAGTPGGVLTTDQTGEGASVAVTMRDPLTGAERWHHRRWNREAGQAPVVSTGGELVALSGKRRDDTMLRYVTVLDSRTGRVRADVPFDGDPGSLEMVSDTLVVHLSGTERQNLTARDFSGRTRWTYRVPAMCTATATADAGERVTVALGCRAENGTAEESHVLALDADSGRALWDWVAAAEGRVFRHGMVVVGDRVVVDVRRDESPNDGMFAARMYRHDVNAISLAEGESVWRRENLELGNTYAPACAGTLQVAGGESGAEPVVLLGECHQISGAAGASMDVTVLAADDGDGVYTAKAPLGYSPTRDEDTSRWFMGLPDGRVVLAVDASMDLNRPDCRWYVAGPEKGETTRLPVPESIAESGWCQRTSLQLTPNGVAAGYVVEDGGGFFALR